MRNTFELCDAARHGDVAAVKQYLYKDQDRIINGDDIENPLCAAVMCNKINVVSALLEAGADMNIQMGKYRRTPLIWAVLFNRFELVRLLINNGADIAIKDSDGMTVFDWGDIKKNDRVAHYLNEQIRIDDNTLIKWTDAQKKHMVSTSIVRMIFIGEQESGKSSLALSFERNIQHMTHKDDRTVVMHCNQWSPSKQRCFPIIDLGGHPSYRTSAKFFYVDNANNIILGCHEITSIKYKKTFTWIKEALTLAPNSTVRLLLTKIDQVDAVKMNELKAKFLKEMCKFIEIELRYISQTTKKRKKEAVLKNEIFNHNQTKLQEKYTELKNNLENITFCTSCMNGRESTLDPLKDNILYLAEQQSSNVTIPLIYQKFYTEIGLLGSRQNDIMSATKLPAAFAKINIKEDNPQNNPPTDEVISSATNYEERNTNQQSYPHHTETKPDCPKEEEIEEKEPNSSEPNSSTPSSLSNSGCKRYVTLEEAKLLFESILSNMDEIENTWNVKECLRFLHNKGLLVWYSRCKELENIVFNDFRTLADLLASLLHHGMKTFLMFDKLCKESRDLFDDESVLTEHLTNLTSKGLMSYELLQAILNELNLDFEKEAIVELINQLEIGLKLNLEEGQEYLFLPYYIETKMDYTHDTPDIHSDPNQISFQCEILGNIPVAVYHQLIIKIFQFIDKKSIEETLLFKSEMRSKTGDVPFYLKHDREQQLRLSLFPNCSVESIRKMWYLIKHLDYEVNRIRDRWYHGLMTGMMFACTSCKTTHISFEYDQPDTTKVLNLCKTTLEEVPAGFLRPLPTDEDLQNHIVADMKTYMQTRHNKQNKVVAYQQCDIPKTGGLFLLEDINVQIYAPRGHSDETFQFSLSRSESSHVNAISDEYLFSPHETTFMKELLVRFPLIMNKQHLLQNLGIKYSNTHATEPDNWQSYSQDLDKLSSDLSFIIWDEHCYLFLQHLCKVVACENHDQSGAGNMSPMKAYLLVKNTSVSRAEIVIAFACTAKEKGLLDKYKESHGDEVDKGSFIIYANGSDVKVNLDCDSTGWKCLEAGDLENHVDKMKFKICELDMDPPSVTYTVEQSNKLNYNCIKAEISQEDKAVTKLKWWPKDTPIVQQGSGIETQTGERNALYGSKEKLQLKEKNGNSREGGSDPHKLPLIEHEECLKPLIDILDMEKSKLEEVAKIAGACISSNINGEKFLNAWFTKNCTEYSQKNIPVLYKIKQELIWLNLYEVLWINHSYKEASVLMQILQKIRMHEKIYKISKELKQFDKFLHCIKDLKGLDRDIDKPLSSMDKEHQKINYIIDDIILENMWMYDVLCDFLKDTGQSELLDDILIQNGHELHQHTNILQETIERNTTVLKDKLSDSKDLCDRLHKNQVLSLESCERIIAACSNFDVILQEIQYTMTCLKWPVFLQVLQKSGFDNVASILVESYLILGGKPQYCEIKEISHIKEFAHACNFGQSYDEIVCTLPDFGQNVCLIKWPKGTGTGMLLGVLQPTPAASNTTKSHGVILTCQHLLDSDFITAINHNKTLNTSQVIFRFYDANKESKDVSCSILDVITFDKDLDYALLCLEDSPDLMDNVTTPATSILGKYIRNTNHPPKHESVLNLIGYPGGNTKILDPSVVINCTDAIKQEGILSFPVTVDDSKRVFYNCSSLHGASGAPCFDLEAKILYLMHQGGKFLGSDSSPGQRSKYEYGVLLYYVVMNVKKKIEDKKCPLLTMEGFNLLFPNFTKASDQMDIDP